VSQITKLFRNIRKLDKTFENIKLVAMNMSFDCAERIITDFSPHEIPEVPLVGCYTYKQAHPALRKHIHSDVYEVCLLQHGTQPYRVEKSLFDLSAGDMLITRPGEIHGTDTEPENRGRLYWVQFRKPKTDRPYLGLSPHAAQLLVEPLNQLTNLQFHNCELLLATFDRLLSAAPTPAMPKALAKANIQNLLLRLLMDIVSLTARETQRDYSAGVRKVIQHLGNHREVHITLSELVSISGTSDSYLKTHFKREVGMTPMEYLMWLRIEQSKRLLRETGNPITDIALQCGFVTSQHFATVFKRLTSTTPRDYRRSGHRQSQGTESPVAGTGPRFHPVSV
jgi:AraC-like DNA-binding protein